MELLVDGVYQLGTRAVNSYIIDGAEGVTLVDTLTARREDASNPPRSNWFVEESVQFGSIASSRLPATQGGFVKSVRVVPDM